MTLLPPDLSDSTTVLLPEAFQAWFAQKRWAPRTHQLDLIQKARAGRSTLLIAPTGAGKTLAGFLPSLTDLYNEPHQAGTVRHLHTLYISPLKALAVDIERNLSKPIEDMALNIRAETRTGDTPQSKRTRQRKSPPDILMTTPEQVALLISQPDSDHYFGKLKFIIFDELHSLVTNKRGHLLSLALARLRKLSPDLKTIGLSATVAQPDELRAWLVPQPERQNNLSELVTVKGGAAPNITILRSEERMPWQGHTGRYAVGDVYNTIKQHNTSLVFVNTRFQAELMFQELWRINDDNLPIALHHGSLDASQRRKIERAMAGNELRAVVATSTLEMGIDWGDVDCVLNMGGPKGASRLAQRIGRSNHRMDEASRAVLVPNNRFEVIECQIALEANYVGAQDTDSVGEGSLDVLAQHIWGMACAAPFDEDELFHEVTSASPYAWVSRDLFGRMVEFVATGGYALRAYERFARIRKTKDGFWRLSHPSFAQQYRLNVGTIVEATSLNVRFARKRKGGTQPLGGGRTLGKVEEYFTEQLTVGDTFLFGGRVLRFEGIHENECLVSDASHSAPKVPSYAGGKFPMSTYLASGMRAILADRSRWHVLPDQVVEWLDLQRLKSMLPAADEMLIETFPRRDRHYLVAHPFEGRLAHQTLGMLITKRLERAGAKPMGFVASDYALAIWSIEDMSKMIASKKLQLDDLFDQDMLGDDLEAWLADSYLLKRTFRQCAVISGLIERRYPGKEKTGRQVTVSTDLIYDVLRTHEPDHVLMQATRADAAKGLLDIRRVSDCLARIKGRIVHRALDKVSPLSVPVMLEVGKESVPGEANDALLREVADELVEEALT